MTQIRQQKEEVLAFDIIVDLQTRNHRPVTHPETTKHIRDEKIDQITKK